MSLTANYWKLSSDMQQSIRDVAKVQKDTCGDEHEPATNSRWTECAVCGVEPEMVPFYVRGEEVAQ